MAFIREKSTNIIILIVLAAGIWFRLAWYGDLRLSIANAETESYITSSRSALFSWELFAGKRLFTTNIIYKMANAEQSCPVTAYSTPAIGVEGYRAIQSCFDKIVILQSLLSIFGWSFLAWTIARHLKSLFTKITITIIIMLFAFTPQIVEWDSILGPEPLAFSLLMISFALLLEIAFRRLDPDISFGSVSDTILITGWIILFLFWVFVRDVHLYVILTSLILFIPLPFLKAFRRSKPLITIILILAGFFILGYLSARDSLRATRDPLVHAFDVYIWPYPQRVEFIKGFGMPQRESPEFQAWFDANATKTYGLFLVSHPGFVTTTLWENLDQFKSNFIQPYFGTSDIKYRDILLQIGEFVHPETNAVYLLDFILLLALTINAIKYRNTSLVVWSWLAAWFFLASAITLIPSFFGDIGGTRRHIFPSVEMFRLFPWIFLMPFLDLSLLQMERTSE
jgi:hypothetical protein